MKDIIDKELSKDEKMCEKIISDILIEWVFNRNHELNYTFDSRPDEQQQGCSEAPDFKYIDITKKKLCFWNLDELLTLEFDTIRS